MNFTKATDQQIKTIIEWDIGIPTPLLKEVYEEAIKRRVLEKKVTYWIVNFFKTTKNAERKTGLPIEDLLWISYEIGFERMDNYKPTHPFAAYWYKAVIRGIMTIARDNNAQKRQGEVYSLEDIHEWTIPGGNHVEPIALQRVYIESLMNQLTEIEKDIVIKRYQGYYLREIGEMQGVSKGGIQKRIEIYQKRLKGA